LPAGFVPGPRDDLPPVVNGSGAAIDAPFGVLRVTTPVELPADKSTAPYEGLKFTGAAPDAATTSNHRFVVLQEPAGDGQPAPAVFVGPTWVKVNVSDESHTHAVAIAGDTAKLASASSGVQVLWKESGTGEKWAVVLLGGGGASGRPILLSRCVEAGAEPIYRIVNDSLISSLGTLLSAHFGQVAVIEQQCWQVIGDTALCGTSECVIVSAILANCSACGGCYTLTNCDDSMDVLLTTNHDVAAYGTVDVAGVCREVAAAEGCNGATFVDFDHGYADCETCQSCYEITNCNSSETRTIAADDHELTTGQTIVIDGECWTVTDFDSCSTIGGTVEHVTIEAVLEDCDAGCCYDFVACAGTAGGDRVVFQATDAVTSERINLEDLINMTVRTDDGGCYQVAKRPGACGGSEEAVVIQESYASCSLCTSYELDHCSTGTLTTYSDLSEYTAGDVLKRAEDEECYTLVGPTAWSGGDVPLTVEKQFEDCTTCGDPHYKLTADCLPSACSGSPSGEVKVTDEDLAEAVGKYIAIGDTCYAVEDTTDAVTDPAPLTYEGPYDNCEACSDTPAATKVLVLEGGGPPVWKTVMLPKSCGGEGATGECPSEE
jgi:hypothetical protein